MTLVVPTDLEAAATCAGHAQVGRLLEGALPNDHQAWCGGGRDGRPDFVLVGPQAGVVVLCVVSESAEEVQGASFDGILLRDGSITDPLTDFGRQIEAVRLDLEGTCDDGLIRPVFILTGYSQAEYEASPLPGYFLAAAVVPAKGMSASDLPAPLVREDGLIPSDVIRDIRAALFPETVFEVRPPVSDPDRDERAKVRIQLDARQQTAASQVDSGITFLTGVAGSGKTLVLAARARYLAREHPTWDIQVLCFNKTLRRYLQSLVGVDCENVHVNHVTAWRNEMGVSWDSEIAYAADHGVPKRRYDAILIDEVQDFRPLWLRYIKRCLRGSRGGLLMAGDLAQAIYDDDGGGFAFAPDEMTVIDLPVNYRNTAQIGRFSWGAVFGVGLEADGFGRQVTGRDAEEVQYELEGPPTQVVYAGTQALQARMIVDEIARLMEEDGVSPKDVGILHSNWRQGQLLSDRLDEAGIPYLWITRDKETRDFPSLESNVVKLITIQSCKGLDFPVVFLYAVESLKVPASLSGVIDPKEMRFLKTAYVGMTRARDLLYVTYSRVNPVMGRALELDEFCEARQYPEDFE